MPNRAGGAAVQVLKLLVKTPLTGDRVFEFATDQRSVRRPIALGRVQTFMTGSRTTRKTAPIGYSRSEEHTSELQSLMRISYAVFCLKKKIYTHEITI